MRLTNISSPKRALATMLALGAASATVVFGSYAAWTAQTTNTNSSVTAGTLTMTNNKNAAAVFTATGLKPGDAGSSTVVVTNTGSSAMLVKLTQSDVNNGFTTATDIKMSIHDDTTNRCIWPTQASGACATAPVTGAWNATATLTNFVVDGTAGAGTTWATTEAHTFTMAYELIAASGNNSQGDTADFDLTWDGS